MFFHNMGYSNLCFYFVCYKNSRKRNGPGWTFGFYKWTIRIFTYKKKI